MEIIPLEPSPAPPPAENVDQRPVEETPPPEEAPPPVEEEHQVDEYA